MALNSIAMIQPNQPFVKDYSMKLVHHPSVILTEKQAQETLERKEGRGVVRQAAVGKTVFCLPYTLLPRQLFAC